MASKGGYLGGSTIIKVHRKRSNISKRKEKEKKRVKAKLAQDYAAYKAKLELPTRSVSPTKAAPSKTGKKRSERVLKELEPVINQLRQLARDFTKITSEPSNLVRDLAIYETQSMANIVGVRRGLAGFDGWRIKKRVRAICGMIPQSSKEAVFTPIMIDGLDQEWDELCLVLFDDIYNTHSIYSVGKGQVYAVIGELGWENKSPAFVLPLSVLMNISKHVSGKQLDPTAKTTSVGSTGRGKKRSRYLRST